MNFDAIVKYYIEDNLPIWWLNKELMCQSDSGGSLLDINLL